MGISVPHFDLAMVCGRFGHMHLGHESLFNLGLELCQREYIIVGSAQERGTLRNPFSVETRIQVIRENYPGVPEDRLIIGGLNDMTNELDINEDWGRYLKKHITNKMHKFANLMIYGNDEFRSRWFAPEDIIGTHEFVVARSTIPISGTQIRGLLVIDNEAEWQKWTPEMIHHLYQKLRNEIMEVPVYREIYDLVRRETVMDMDAFMKVYARFEEADRQAKLAEIKD